MIISLFSFVFILFLVNIIGLINILLNINRPIIIIILIAYLLLIISNNLHKIMFVLILMCFFRYNIGLIYIMVSYLSIGLLQ